jgi:hypothetical protein
VVGVYFIDHIQHINTMDDPRVNKFELQMNMLRYFFAIERDDMIAGKRAVLADRILDLNEAELEYRADLKYQVDRLTEELDNMEKDTAELDQMTRRMEVDNFDQLRSQKLTQAKIEDLKREFMRQAGLRQAYEEDLEQLVEFDVASMKTIPAVPVYDGGVETFNHYVDLDDEQQTPSQQSTRLERELGLLELTVCK